MKRTNLVAVLAIASFAAFMPMYAADDSSKAPAQQTNADDQGRNMNRGDRDWRDNRGDRDWRDPENRQAARERIRDDVRNFRENRDWRGGNWDSGYCSSCGGCSDCGYYGRGYYDGGCYSCGNGYYGWGW